MRAIASRMGILAVLAACEPNAPPGAGQASALAGQATQVDVVGMTSALSTSAQRHIVRLQPANHSPVYLMAVQNDGYSQHHHGLLWYRSDDGGATWSHYADVIAQPDPAAFDSALRPQTLHLTADLVAIGNDVAAVYSYDTTATEFPADAWDPRRAVYLQWWRFDGRNDWSPDPRLTVASPGPGQAYHRAEIARDTLGRLWVQAFLRQSDCSSVGSASCAGDLLQVWVSDDGGSTFQGPQTLAALQNQIGGGRLIGVGSQLLMLWSDYSLAPAQLMRRSDSDPVTLWSAQQDAFPDGAHVYHGAALSAVSDETGDGLDLVYKEWVSSPDNQQLYYRHFDGQAFGQATPVDTLGDWALQAAISRSGDDLYICVNHMISTDASYEMRSYRLADGFATWSTIDTQVQAKAYPGSPEQVDPGDAAIPCAFGMGNNSTQFWGAGHTVQVALEPVQAGAATAATPTFNPAPGAYTSAQSVALSDATPGATIYFTTDGSAPTTSSTRYTGPIAVSVTTTIRAIAAAPGFSDSAVATGTFNIESAGSALFSDDFTRTSGLGATWRIWYGSYTTDGASAVSGAAPIEGSWASVVPALGTSDYAVVATISLPPRALYSGVVARSGGSDFTRDLYCAQISSAGAVNLYRRDAWSWTLLGTASAGIQVSTPYTLQLTVTGSSPVHLEVSLDGTTVITYDDTSTSRITSGVPGMESYDASVRYDSFAVLAR
jgi:hypothetical protein